MVLLDAALLLVYELSIGALHRRLAARFGPIMVPTRRGPRRAFIGQPSDVG
jgi:hypothetical protein